MSLNEYEFTYLRRFRERELASELELERVRRVRHDAARSGHPDRAGLSFPAMLGVLRERTRLLSRLARRGFSLDGFSGPRYPASIPGQFVTAQQPAQIWGGSRKEKSSSRCPDPVAEKPALGIPLSDPTD